MGYKYFFSFPTLEELKNTDLSTIDPRQLLKIYKQSIAFKWLHADFRPLLKNHLDTLPHLKKKKFLKKKNKAQLK